MTDTPAARPATSRIFRREITLEQLAQIHRDTVVGLLGIEFTEIGDGTLAARMPVDRRTVQPAGILHGGASVTLAETLGSCAAWLTLDDDRRAVGLDINANHLRAMRDGWVYGRCHPVHLGRSTQVWQIEISDDQGRPVCTSRLTMAVVPNPPAPAAPPAR
jgi:1,4-dihydroxy-2-naphthoyl-CoA hydrolase